MFTGIIETTGIVKDVVLKNNNVSLWVQSNLSKKIKPNQSIAHNGVCLTVEAVNKNLHLVTLVHESLNTTNFKQIKKNDTLNLELCLKIGDRLDGHFMQGHVDTTAKIKRIKDEKGSWLFTCQLANKKNNLLIVEKGSIAINGVSLTCFNVNDKEFSVAIIPQTLKITTFVNLNIGDIVNIEFDILGKYILKHKSLNI